MVLIFLTPFLGPLFWSQKTVVVGANNSEVSNVVSDEDTVQDAEVPSLEQKKNK